ncbi:MAG TPA: 50S ribosomal protein L21 [Dehalococcoidia bacterium]|nr:50S ribosomal protein L21 [Dehalococcoidia bacterium]
MFAVVRTGGKQYRVTEGQRLRVDRLPGDVGASVELGDVLMFGEGADVTLGAPTVAGARVLGTIAEQGRAEKVVVFRYKAKTRSRKKTGHRQHYTLLTIDDILAPGQQPKPKQERPAAQAPAEAEAEPKGRRGRRKAAEAAAPVTGAEAVAGVPGEDGDSAPEAAAEPEAPTAEAEAPAEKPKRTRRKKDE